MTDQASDGTAVASGEGRVGRAEKAGNLQKTLENVLKKQLEMLALGGLISVQGE